ncbi:MAG TPA: bifunctional hydroxymethylpyrimidine kinase/phosphomethylpyrimidine kinase [bacterium]|nr:bifunctional hydroxymethylpyrimidine kinase/phosphomethylpyrimidine kinase [bacterium]
MILRALTIAGSDSGGGAGIQADLKTFTAFRVYGMSVLTAVTAQNTVRVHGIEYISPRLVGLQFEAVMTDIGVDGLKTGMLGSTAIIQEVAGKLRDNAIAIVVVDPVMVSTGGDALIEEQGVKSIKADLIPLSTLVTPNIPEAEILSGVKIRDFEDMKRAAFEIHRLGCGAVLVKGGHLTEDAVDILFDGDRFSRFSAPRIKTSNTHGTGCTYSAAVLACLLLGNPLNEAVHAAKRYVTAAIREGLPLGKGHGPLNHCVRVE